MHCLLFVVLSRDMTINFTHYWTCLKFKKTLDPRFLEGGYFQLKFSMKFNSYVVYELIDTYSLGLSLLTIV